MQRNLNQNICLLTQVNANAGLGKKGIEDAKQTCVILADCVDCNATEIFPFSTGVIGELLRVEKITQSYPKLVENLNKDAWLNAAKAIMTTDTVAKGYSEQLQLEGNTVSITGIAKGAGMIRPDMATMLAYIATDLIIETSDLEEILNKAVDQSFSLYYR